MHNPSLPRFLVRRAPLATLLLALGPSVAPAQTPPDTGALRRAAQGAEARYERVARWLAPTTYAGGTSSDRCTEIVGRFCLTFDSLAPPRAARAEHGEVGESRRSAIAAQRRYFDAAPGELRAAAPLVRLLVEDGRAREAVHAAREFAVRTDSLVWRDWLLGYTLHAVGEDSMAAVHFERAERQATLQQRREIAAIDWLLDPAERKRLRALDAVARGALERRFWSLADPRLDTHTNELRVQHTARWVEARVRERIPVVSGMQSWGRDLEELTIRYGSPVAREKVASSLPFGGEDSFIEHFDSTALSFAPRRLDPAELEPPRPGERWPLADPAPRSAHAIASLPRVLPLAHQLTRLPRGDSMLLRIDFAASDTAAAQASTASAFALSLSGVRIAERRVSAQPGDVITLTLLAPRDTLIYAAEIYHSPARTLERARYVIDPLARAALELSDLLLTRPLPEGDSIVLPPARTELQLPPDSAVGIVAEVHGLESGATYEVDVAFARAERASAAARALGWIGRRLGLSSEARPVQAKWTDQAKVGEPTARIALNLVTPAAPGFYFLRLRVRSADRAAQSERLVRVSDGSAAVR